MWKCRLDLGQECLYSFSARKHLFMQDPANKVNSSMKKDTL